MNDLNPFATPQILMDTSSFCVSHNTIPKKNNQDCKKIFTTHNHWSAKYGRLIRQGIQFVRQLRTLFRWSAVERPPRQRKARIPNLSEGYRLSAHCFLVLAQTCKQQTRTTICDFNLSLFRCLPRSLRTQTLGNWRLFQDCQASVRSPLLWPKYQDWCLSLADSITDCLSYSSLDWSVVLATRLGLESHISINPRTIITLYALGSVNETD